LSLLFLLLYSGVKGEPFYRTAAQDGTLYVLAGVLVASGYVVYLSELRGILRQIGHLLEFWLGAFGFLIPVIAAILYSITVSERAGGRPVDQHFQVIAGWTTLAFGTIYSLSFELARTWVRSRDE
jgi:hypothetical protein